MGVTLCDERDIKKRLQLGDGDSLTDEQAKAWPSIAEEATGIVEGYLKRKWTPTVEPLQTDAQRLAEVPPEIRTVVSRMTVRAMNSPVGPGAPIDGQQSSSSTFGPMSYARGYSSDAVFTSPWLSKVDRIALSPYRKTQAVQNEPMFDDTKARFGHTLDSDWSGGWRG